MPPPGEAYANDIEQAKGRLTWFESGLRYAHVTLIGYRYSVERLAPDPSARATPNVFVSHGGPTRTHVDQVRDFLTALGLQPIIVADLPNLNLSVNEKVRFYMNLCTGGIALATSVDETTAKEQRTRPNVENEIGMFQTAPNIGDRIIYLKEPAVKFATNYSEKVWISFSKERIQDAFISIARELRAFGFLGAG
jgi:predicted nucleotide-binding protein